MCELNIHCNATRAPASRPLLHRKHAHSHTKPPGRVSNWRVKDVCRWLCDSLELGLYEEAFSSHSIDGHMLWQLTDVDLEEMNVKVSEIMRMCHGLSMRVLACASDKNMLFEHCTSLTRVCLFVSLCIDYLSAGFSPSHPATGSTASCEDLAAS